VRCVHAIRWGCVWGLCLTAVTTLAAPDDPARPVRLEISVRTYNYAQVPVDTLVRAEGEAARLFHAIGVGARWGNFTPSAGGTEKDSNFDQMRGPATIEVRVFSRFQPIPGKMGPPALGVVVGSFADVSFEEVSRLAAKVGAMPDEVLGLAMAHEIGHLLLPTRTHSLTGVMREGWDAKDFLLAAQGRLLFTHGQARHIRIAVAARQRNTGNDAGLAGAFSVPGSRPAGSAPF